MATTTIQARWQDKPLLFFHNTSLLPLTPSKEVTYFKDTNISNGEIKRYEIIAAGDTAGRAVYDCNQ